MKLKMLLVAALLGAATLSAQAGVNFGFSFGLPLPYVTAPAPVVVPPATVYAPPAVAVPACPGPDYVWAPGYWSVGVYGRTWVPGCWNYRPGYWHGGWGGWHGGWHGGDHWHR